MRNHSRSILTVLMMLLAAFVLVNPAPTFAQAATFPTQPQVQLVLPATASTGTTSWLNLSAPDARDVHYWTMTWYAFGTVATCQVKVEKSADQVTASDLIANQACTSTGTVSTSSTAETNYVRINLGTKTGSGTVVVVANGYRQNPFGSISISGSITPSGTQDVNVTQTSGVPLTSGRVPVDVQTISAAATGPQVAASSDSVVCATDTGCVIKAASGNIASGALASGSIASGALASGAAAAGAFSAQSFAVGAIPPAPGVLIRGAITSAMTATTSTLVISGTASNYNYITSCVTSNGSTTVSTDIILQDGSGGTTLYTLPAPAASVSSTGGGGGSYIFPTPLPVPTSGNGLYAANVTTGASTKISCLGFRSTVSY